MKKIKSLIALALVFAMLAAYAPFASAVKLKSGLEGKPNTGDVDNNGYVTAADARLVLRYCAKLEPFDSDQWSAADVDMDECVTPLDARAILRIAAGLDMSTNIDLTYRSDSDDADKAIRDAIKAYNTAATKIKKNIVQKKAKVEQTINTKADISLSWALKLFLRSFGQDPSELEQGFTYPDETTYYLDSNGLVKALPPEGSNAVNIPLDAQTIYGMLKTNQQCTLFFNPENFSNDSVYTKALPVKDFAKLNDPFALLDDAGGDDLDSLIRIKSKSLKYNGGSLFYELDSEGNLTKATYYCQAVATYKMEFLETSTFTMDMKITIDITQEFTFS